MITKAQAMAATYRQEFHHVTAKNRDGSPVRVRVNGACKTWKREPDRFQLPVKQGLYAYGYITETNAREWVQA